MKISKANMINRHLIQDDHNLFCSCVTLLMPFICLASIETGFDMNKSKHKGCSVTNKSLRDTFFIEEHCNRS